jgi:Zn-dependent protease
MQTISWKLGRTAGIDLYMHPTFLILLAYAAHLDGTLGVVFTVAMFACVLLHELGHSLTARRFGIETLDITLYPIGGVARLERMPRKPGVELLVALAGPAVNFFIAAMLWSVTAVVGLGTEGLVGQFVAGLVAINLVLGLFNLIPAFPMDGGRVLRALLSGWLGRVRATEIAAGLGRGLAVAFGAYCFFSGAYLQMVLAAFIYIAAGAELRQVTDESQNGPPGGRGHTFRWTNPRRVTKWSYGSGTWKLAPIPNESQMGQGRRGARGPWR